MTTRTLALIAAVLLVLLVGSVGFFVQRSLEREQELGVGRRFPSVEARLISPQDAVMRLPSGKKTLVVFFKHNCPHCANELSRLDRACRQLPEGNLDCVAIAFDQEPQTRAWALTNGLALKIAVVQDREFIEQYVDSLTAVPLVFLIAEDGVIKYKRGGERSDEYDAAIVRDFAGP